MWYHIYIILQQSLTSIMSNCPMSLMCRNIQIQPSVEAAARSNFSYSKAVLTCYGGQQSKNWKSYP